MSSYLDYYRNLEEEWVYVNGIPWWQKGTISLSVYEVSRHKRVTVICLYEKPDGSFLYPYKLHISQAKIKGNVRNNRVTKSNINGCWCYQVPLDMFTNGLPHRRGEDYPENMKYTDFSRK